VGQADFKQFFKSMNWRKCSTDFYKNYISICPNVVRIEKEKKNDAIINNLRVLTPFAYEIVINYK
jgi:hypothetical protein